MNNPNPFVPKGSLLEQQSQRRSRLKLAVFCVLSVSVVGLVAMLIQGCKRENPDATNGGLPPPDTNVPTFSTPTPSVADTNPPVPVAAVASNPPPVVSPVVNPPVTPPVEAAGTEYVVEAGDTLAKIAKAHGITTKALMDANPTVDPKKLQIKKTKLVIPPPAPAKATAAATPAAAGAADAGGETYAVKNNDTLTKIAHNHGITVKALRAANPKYATTDHIHVGEKLVIPTKAATAAPAPEAAATPAVPAVSTPAPGR